MVSDINLSLSEATVDKKSTILSTVGFEKETSQISRLALSRSVYKLIMKGL